MFYLIAAITLAGALAAMTLKHLVHAALAVTVAFAGLALFFLSLDAQFAGFAQILVYIGAVAILVVFAILLTHGAELPRDGVFSRTWFVGLPIAAGIFAVLGWAVIASSKALPSETATPMVDGHLIGVADIGVALVGRYVLPLEIVALLLTAATIGAVIVALHEKERAR